MGARFSCKSSETTGVLMPTRIRVVHLDGSLEDYEDPATVDQVISNFPKHFLCAPIEIIRSGLVPLNLNQQLRSGQIYFMLPNSTLKFNSSPMDLSSLTKKLMTIAKTGRCSAKSAPTSPSASPLNSRRPTSPNHSFDRRCGDTGEESMIKSVRWKPNLGVITEG
ncbi:hypothetical protein E3N88_36040 [Mikania micrantha]|uniref:Uncharacterized protein n=1 Tax=Mikania micrantha TaxID=192012 RepID=A0A5N6M2L6_9ASTR|nr:hypothetical protein E3N88_36040 [Mikania micrantha]